VKPLAFIQAIYLLWGVSSLSAQTPGKGELDIEAFMEERFAFQEEDIDYEDLYETLLQVHLQPLNLHHATAEQLRSLFILTPLQVESFIRYRDQFGPLLSIYELQAIPEWDLPTIEKILPFVLLEPDPVPVRPPGLKRLSHAENAYLILRHRRIWQTRKGFSPPDTLSDGRLSSRYLGDPNDAYVRLRLQQPGDFSVGLTAEKDAGEPFSWDPGSRRYGMDFLSLHYTLYNKGALKTLTLGDYQLQFGQGLVFGAGFSVGKGAETIATVRRSSLGLRPYTSVLETGFFRGAAATVTSGNLAWTAMYSYTPRNATVQLSQDSLEVSDSYLSSLVLSGYHRTESEIQKKARAREKNIGGNIHYKNPKNGLQAGANFLYTRYSRPLLPRFRIYNQFEFRGDQNAIGSLYFSYNFANHYLFGETALSRSGGTGSVLGIISSLSRKVDFSLAWRNFERNFHSFYGNAFSEGSRPINEAGVYMGINYKPSRKINWSAYYDHFSFPWLRFRAYAPSAGSEWLSRFTYTPNKSLIVFLQYREERKSRNLLSEEQSANHYLLMEGTRRNFAWNLAYQPTSGWQAKTRIQQSSFSINGRTTRGYAISQDLSGEINRFTFSGRISLFDTDDFENRQFLFEKNVLWAFSVPSFYGQGMRYYLLASYEISRHLTGWIRWAKTSYSNREGIGSGLQEIPGSEVTETTIQLRYRLHR
jgi:hypothetical protein